MWTTNPSQQQMDRRLVDHLVNSNLVSRGAMQRMILRASKNKTGVVEQLFADSKIEDSELARELAAYYDLDLVKPDSFTVNETALKFISKSMADKHGVLPFAINDSADKVAVAVYNPESAQSVVESLKTATGNEPTVHVAPRSWLTDAIRHFYFGESWAAAPAHKAATREVADVSDEFGAMASSGTTEESSEIILDEVIVPPKPKRKRNGSSAEAQLERQPEPRPDPKREPQRRRSSAPGEASGEVEAALDEFDAFLDSSTGWGASSGSSKIPGWEDEEEAVDDPFSLKSTSAGNWEQGGFSLFDEQSEGGEAALRELVEEHEEVIERLRRELQQQRDIITALVEALADSGVVSKREIKHRVKRK